MKNEKMQRRGKITFALACILVLSQWATFAHGAKFGFDKHDHEGVTCAITLHNSAQYAILDASDALEEQPVFESFDEAEYKVVNCDQSLNARSIRGPPISTH